MMEKTKNSRTIKNLKGFLWKAPVFIVAFFLSLAILITLTLSFNFTKTLLLRGILSFVNKELEGKISFTNARLDIFRGISIENLLLTYHTDTILFVPRVRVDWDLSPLTQKKVFVKFVELYNPQIKLVKEKGDNLWNFEKIIKKKTKDTASSETVFSIFLEKINLLDGNIVLIDKNHISLDTLFNPSNLKLSNIYLLSKGQIQFKSNHYYFEINRFSFIEKNSNFLLKDLNAVLNIDSSNVHISNFSLQTPETSINGDFEFLKSSILININSSIISTNDVLKFVNVPLESGVTVEFKGETEIGDEISIRKVNLSFGDKSFLLFDLYVNPQPNSLDVKISNVNGNILERDIRKALPKIFQNVPSKFEFFSPKNLLVEINSNGYFFKGTAESGLGNISFDFSIVNSNIYNFNITFAQLDVSKISRGFPNTNLTGTGKGTVNFTNGINKVTGLLEVDILKGWATVKGFENFGLRLSSQFKNGKIEINRLMFSSFSNDKFEINKFAKPNLVLNGFIDISNIKNIIYRGNVLLQDFNLKNFTFQKENYPENITGSIEFSGEGTNPNTLKLNLNADIQDFVFSDRQLFPFSISFDIQHQNKDHKFLRINSDILKLKVEGNYEILSLLNNISKEFETIANSIKSKIVLNNSNSSENVTSNLEKTKIKVSRNRIEPLAFKPSNFSASFEISDFSILGILLNTNVAFSGFGKISFKQTEIESSLDIDTFQINFLSFEVEKNKYSLANTYLTGYCGIYIENNEPKVREINFHFESESRAFLGSSFLDYLYFSFGFDGDKFDYNISTLLNSAFQFEIHGNASSSDSNFIVNLDKFLFSYSNIFQWNLVEPAQITFDSSGVFVKELRLARENAENISISANYFFDDTISAKLQIMNVPLTDFQKLLPQENSLSNIHKFDGKILSIKVLLSNSITNPDINAIIKTENLRFNGYELGDLDLKSHYSNENLEGNIVIKSKSFSPFEVKINKLPIFVNLKEGKFGLKSNQEFRSHIYCDEFNLSLLGPFLSKVVENLNGKSKIDVEVFGFLPDDLMINGEVDLSTTSFILMANNLKYFLKGKINFQENEIEFSNISLLNSVEDLKNGSATVNGQVLFQKDKLEELHLSLKSNGLKILSQASAKSFPEMYGDLIISTDPDELRFSIVGNELKLEGYVNVQQGKLFMPGTFTNESIKESFVKYEISGSQKLSKVDSIDFESTKKKNASNLKIDIIVKILNPIELTLDLTSLGQIYALISLEDKSSTLRYYSDLSNNVTRLFGSDLVLLEGSTLKLVKLFKTEGKINFPTGRIDNPGLDLKAEYSGQSLYNDAIRNFKVFLYVTGTREKPQLRFNYTIDGETAVDDSSKVAQDAIFLLAFGRTKSEFEKGGASNLNLSEFSSSGGSALLSKVATQALSGTGFISSADISLPSYTVSSLDKATLHMSGRFLGLNWRFGGTMADLLNSNELVVEVPIGNILPFYFPNIILQLSRSSSLTQSIQRNQKDWEIKLKYGSTW